MRGRGPGRLTFALPAYTLTISSLCLSIVTPFVVQRFNTCRLFAPPPLLYREAVDLSHLTPQQAQELSARIVPELGYLVRLTSRMQQRGWKADDPAYVAADLPLL